MTVSKDEIKKYTSEELYFRKKKQLTDRVAAKRQKKVEAIQEEKQVKETEALLDSMKKTIGHIGPPKEGEPNNRQCPGLAMIAKNIIGFREEFDQIAPIDDENKRYNYNMNNVVYKPLLCKWIIMEPYITVITFQDDEGNVRKRRVVKDTQVCYATCKGCWKMGPMGMACPKCDDETFKTICIGVPGKKRD